MKRHLPIIIISAFVILLSGISLSHASSAKSIASSPPRSISVKQTGSSLVITWKKPLRHFDGYIIYRSNLKKTLGDVIWRTADPNIRTSFTDSSVLPNTKYFYTVHSFITINGNPTIEIESTNKTQVSKLVKIARQAPAPSSQPPSPSAAPIVELLASPTSITIAQPTTITWASTNANLCIASGGWLGNQDFSGSRTLSPPLTTIYTLTCTGDGGSVSRSVTVTVNPVAVSSPQPAPPSSRLPSPPLNIRVQQTGDSPVITWEKPLQEVDGYKIYRSNFEKALGNAIWRTANPNINPSFTDSSAQQDTKYYYTVRSFLTIHGSNGSPNTEIESTNKTQVSISVEASESGRDKKSVAIVFLYINEPMPNELMARLTDKSWYKEGELQNSFNDCTAATHCFSNNFFFAKDWWEREAKKYNKDFNFDIVPFSTQIELKSNEYTWEEGGDNSFELLFAYGEIRRELEKRMTELIPDLKKYFNVSLVIYGSNVGGADNSNAGYDSTPPFSYWLFANHIFHLSTTDITQNFTEQFAQFRAQEKQAFLYSWIHELFHSFLAFDKYGSTGQQACQTNPATGEEYDYRDLFCHRIPSGYGSGFTMLNDLNQLIISEPTAKEIGWK